MKKIVNAITAVTTSIAFCFLLTSCGQNPSYNLTISSELTNGTIYLTKETFKQGEKVILSCLPKKGYKLLGYTVNGEGIIGNTFIMPSNNVEISANFELLHYSITYVLNGGTVDEGNPDTYTVLDDIELIQPTKEGYECAGWYYYYVESEWYLYDLDEYKVDKIVPGTTGKLTLYAQYYNNIYQISTDHTQDYIDVFTDVYEAIYGQEVTISYNLEDYYEIEYFTLNDERIDSEVFTMPKCDVFVSAVVKPIEYSIYYVLDDGTVDDENISTYTVNTSFELNLPHKEGYDYSEWYYIDDNGYEFSICNISEISLYPRNITLYARYWNYD